MKSFFEDDFLNNQPILSRSNHPVFQFLSRIRRKKEGKKFLIAEGLRQISQIEDYGLSPKFIYCSLSFSETTFFRSWITNYFVSYPECDFYLCTNERFQQSVAGTKNSQGILAVYETSFYLGNESLFQDFLSIEKRIGRPIKNILILEEINDPGNLGTILRSAKAFDFDCVVLSKGSCSVSDEKVLRSALGAVLSVPIFVDQDLDVFLKFLKEKEYQLLGADLQGEALLNVGSRIKTKRAIILGNEARGLSESFKPYLDLLLTIEMKGHMESLNVSVAAGILMYHLSLHE